jgi:hypothetical protein
VPVAGGEDVICVGIWVMAGIGDGDDNGDDDGDGDREGLEVASRLELCMAVIDSKLIVITVVDAPVSGEVAELRGDGVSMVAVLLGMDVGKSGVDMGEEAGRLLGLIEWTLELVEREVAKVPMAVEFLACGEATDVVLVVVGNEVIGVLVDEETIARLLVELVESDAVEGERLDIKVLEGVEVGIIDDNEEAEEARGVAVELGLDSGVPVDESVDDTEVIEDNEVEVLSRGTMLNSSVVLAAAASV